MRGVVVDVCFTTLVVGMESIVSYWAFVYTRHIMFIAHTPAGYLLTKGIQRRMHETRYLWIGLMASVLPDLDLFYFYLIDSRQTLHHEYWTHLPIFWIVLWAIIAIGNLHFKNRAATVISLIFFSNVLLHLALDTFVGGIAWLYPWSSQSFSLITVPATHVFWVFSFVTHWSFLVEIAIIAWAAVVFSHPKRV